MKAARAIEGNARIRQRDAQRNGAGSIGDGGWNVTDLPYTPTSSSGGMALPPMLRSGDRMPYRPCKTHMPNRES